MLSYFLLAAKNKIASLAVDICPCLNPENKKFHNIDDMHRKSRIRNNWEVDAEYGNNGDGKVFTIETMKKLAKMKVVHDGTELDETKDSFILERCPWNSESSDMLLRVGRSIFPVHRFLLSIESEIMRTIIDSVPAACQKTTIVTLNGYDAEEIKMLLTFVYLPDSEIDDENVLILLKLADELMIEELVVRCEEYLLSSHNHSPILLLRIAHKYQLPSLEESAAIKASKVAQIEKHPEFKTLSEKQQVKVANMSKNRYRSGSQKFEPGHYERAVELAGTCMSPQLKTERRLRDIEEAKAFEGRLKFLPDCKKLTRTRTEQERKA